MLATSGRLLQDRASMRLVEIPFIVEPNYEGWRLDRYLQQKLGRASRTRVQRLIRESLVQNGDRRLKASTPVSAGMRIVLVREETPEPSGLPDELQVLHDEDGLLVIDKPAGLPVHPTARYFQGTVTTILGREHRDDNGRRPDPAHRIDRETSGALACGRSPEMTRALKNLFATCRRSQSKGAGPDISKEYLAIVEGSPPWREHRLDLPLALTGEHSVRVRVSVVPPEHPGAREAVTNLEVLARYENDEGAPFSLIRCVLETGRQHQIRAHLHHAGFPIVGDKIYGPDENIFIRFTKGEMTNEDSRLLRLDRQALHAWRLSIPHPGGADLIEVEAPLPFDLRSFLDSMKQEE